ncbi:hypothetical protein [Streptomyces halobius]|uniref:Uncharacterized protein n=1 Tax=Streptomyces halobius TaxID=2879846 RepID=A0ABY4MDA0_9ACTN|nr:hypothetical protein [Streptomyces halobius]UQA95655.1 hypothetical protein K9S39_30705 [Streptomyces halobius]
MNQITAEMQQAANVRPAQVGNGRKVHFTTAKFSLDTLCDRTVGRVLTEQEAAKMRKQCTSCVKVLEEAAAAEAPAVEEAPAVAEVEEPAVEEAPVVAEVEAPAAEEAPAVGRVEVTAYTAAVEQLYLNGRDAEDRALHVDGDAVLETIATLRRMPRWNAVEERFTVNKVALILVRDAQGERVWVRGEADPIRVDATGTPVDADAPAEPGPVDMTAVLAATRMLRRRREVQRVIDNREAARASAPVADGPTPAPGEASAPAVQEPEALAAAPQWRTLKGMEAPFLLYGQEGEHGFRPAGDRKQCTGQPLTIARTWIDGTRRAEDVTGREVYLGGVASKFWVAPTA